jgi:hypothetical protein
MHVQTEKIKQLIEVYGKSQNYEDKAHTKRFCEDFSLSYTQWNAYLRGAQNIGIKIIEQLIDIFPNLNLNWLLKEETNMFIGQDIPGMVSEPSSKYGKNITNLDLLKKLEEIQKEVHKMAEK